MLPRPALFRLSLLGARLARPFQALLPGRLKSLVAMAPDRLPTPSGNDRPQVFPALGPRRKRVALLAGCAQTVLAPQINEATIRLLTRHGCEVVVAPGAGCCGALTHHLGREDAALVSARGNIAAWTAEFDRGGLDAIVINTSGCGTVVKDYGFMFRNDPAWADKAAKVSSLTQDISELMSELGLQQPNSMPPLKLAYHAACSLQHGQRITEAPKQLLRQAGFEVVEVPEAHLCCGSAGTYNLLQPALADRLRRRKVANIEGLKPDAVAAGNIGCLVQIGGGSSLPVLHTVELLDWATGGPRPAALAGMS